MRTSGEKVNEILKRQLFSSFVSLVSDLKTPKEIEIFLQDFFNESELETYIKRLGVFYWLKKGRSYNNIRQNLKVSSATIATAQDISGREGIKYAIKLMEAEEWANQWSEKIKKFVKK